MKRVILFILFFGIGAAIVGTYLLLKKSPGKPLENIIQNVTKPLFSVKDAPSQTLKGNITGMSGEVRWESREATQAAEITSPVTLLQGERIQTGESGSLNVEFPKASLIEVLGGTQIDFIQTLPDNFVVSIASGSATFKKLSNIPVSVRAMHLLIKQKDGELNVTIDTDNGLTNLNIISGSITTAFNDLNLVSNIVEFVAPIRVSFNDFSRSFE